MIKLLRYILGIESHPLFAVSTGVAMGLFMAGIFMVASQYQAHEMFFSGPPPRG